VLCSETKSHDIVLELEEMLMIWFKYLIGFSAFLFLPGASWADTHEASSCSYSDVLSAYDAASAGDTVSIPSCPTGVTWTNTLTIAKPITLQGTGYLDDGESYHTGTKIINTNGTTVIKVDNNSGTADPVRITGIHINMSTNVGYRRAIAVYGGDDYDQGEKITQLQIDNCRIDYGEQSLMFRNIVQGVVYRNYFYNTRELVDIQGARDYSWNNYYQYGPDSQYALFFEDNYFKFDNNGVSSQDGVFYNVAEGANFVIRYNTFDSSEFTNCQNIAGTNLYGDYSGYYRGTMFVANYHNTINANHIDSFFGIRGGSFLVYSNTWTATDAWKVAGAEEENTSSYPGSDQINNSFFWDNTYNGNPVTTSQIVVSYGDAWICVDGAESCPSHTEIWSHAPQSSGGRNVYPGNPGDTDMYFTSSGPNAYYPYTPYTYPHPLRSGIIDKSYSDPDNVIPAPPSSLKVVDAD
jgi:hypothetical protein